MADDAGNTPVVLLCEIAAGGGKKIGHATLNAEKTLNALSLDMVRSLDAALARWAKDASVVCVVIDGAGDKGFCAGGDVRFLRDASLSFKGVGPNPQAETFFGEEYRLDYRIHTYPKPVMVWGGGIVMGGGLGLLAGASHRVLTETSRIAMPEITIGLFPDVGGSWFLPRMPGRAGLFLALTGAAINASDALYLGLGDHLVATSDRSRVLEALTRATWSADADDNRSRLTFLLREFSMRKDAAPESNVRKHADAIARMTEGATLAEVRQQITGYAGEDAWLKRAAGALASGSPTTAALIWELRRRAQHLGLAEVFRMELIVALQCCAHPDFPEGVRALLIEKDNKPKWTPATPEAVTAEWIEEHFTAPWSALANEVSPLADLGRT
jgi:enoyl-CoA hydratase/carnithine racemase